MLLFKKDTIDPLSELIAVAMWAPAEGQSGVDMYEITKDLKGRFVVCVVSIRQREKDGKRYGHIMDPKTGRPAESGLQSVTILHDNGILCDAFSTACFVLGEEKSIMLWRALGYYEFIMVTDDGRLLVSEGNAGRFTIDENCPYKLEIIRR